MPMTVSTNSPSMNILPSTSRPSPTKNAVTVSRSATVMPTWSKRRMRNTGPPPLERQVKAPPPGPYPFSAGSGLRHPGACPTSARSVPGRSWIAVCQEPGERASLGLQTLPGVIRERLERGRLDATFDRAPDARDMAIDEQSRQDIAVVAHDERPVCIWHQSAPVLVREEDAVPHRQEPRRRRRLLGRQGAAGQVVERRAIRTHVADEFVAERLERRFDRRAVDRPELRDVLQRRRAESGQVAADEPLDRCRHVLRAGLDPRADISRSRAEGPGRATRGVDERAVLPHRPPNPGLRAAELLLEPSLDVLVGPRGGGERQQIRDQGIDVRDRDALAPEAAVVESCRPQRRLHRLMEGRVVGGGDGMERDPQELGLDDRLVRERGVEVGWIEALDPVPQRDVGRRRFLRLERDDATDRLDDLDRFPAAGAVAGPTWRGSATGGELHRGNPSRARSARDATVEA